jgi:DNA gyrase inhibitor GyrI
MSTRRITICVPEDIARRIKKAAANVSVSAWVTDVVEASLNDAELERAWEAFYASVGPSSQDKRRANTIFNRLTRPSRRKRAA